MRSARTLARWLAQPLVAFRKACFCEGSALNLPQGDNPLDPFSRADTRLSRYTSKKSRAQNAGFFYLLFLFIQLLEASLFLLYPCLFELNFTVRLPALFLYGYFLFFMLLVFVVHWTTLSFLFFVKVPFGKIVRNHRLYPPRFLFVVLLLKSVRNHRFSYPPLPFVCFRPIPVAFLPTLSAIPYLCIGFSSLFFFERFEHFLFVSFFLYLYYSTNFLFVKGFLKNFFNFFKFFL